MSYGVRLKNQFGSSVIDQRYYNLEFKSKYTVSLGGVLNPGGGRSATLTIENTKTPIIAIRSIFGVAIAGSSSTGSSTTYRFVSNVYPPSTGSFEVFYFDEPSQDVLPSGWGARVRNPDTGDIVWDSRRKYCKLKGRFNGNSWMSDISSKSETMPFVAAFTPSFWSGERFRLSYQSPPDSGFWYLDWFEPVIGMSVSSSNTMELKACFISNSTYGVGGDLGSGVGTRLPYDFLIIDVTSLV